jgi:hypothetical protein
MNQLSLLPVVGGPPLVTVHVGDYIEATIKDSGDRVRGEVAEIHPDAYWLKCKIGDRELSPIIVEKSSTTIILPAQNRTYTQWVGEYSKRVRGQLLWYFRYYWMDGDRTSHAHIPGGNTSSDKALYHRSEVKRMISEGKGPIEITKTLRLWSQGRGWNLNRLPTGSVGRKEEHIP